MTRQIRKASALSIAGVATKGAAFVVVASLLAACGSDNQPTEPPPVADAAFSDMAGAMDKAHAVEGTLQEHKDSLDRTLEQNENPTAE